MIQKTARLPAKIHDALVAEANKSGIGKPAVLAREIIVTRLRKGNWEALGTYCRDLPSVAVKDPRITIRFSDQYTDLVEKAAAQICDSKFNPLVLAILAERYSKAVRKAAKQT